MKKIAILTSGHAEATIRLVSLFNGGDRVKVEFVITDDAKETFENLKEKGVIVMNIPDEVWEEKNYELVSIFKEKEIDLLVADNFNLPVAENLIEAAGGKFLNVSSPDEAPKEVVTILEEDLRKPIQELENDNPDQPLSPEQEWARALKINFIPPKIPVTPPPIPADSSTNPETQNYNQHGKPYPHEDYRNNFQRENYSNNFHNSGEFRHENYHENHEPMPSTYLIWSILCTIFCCFIPGIIAIIFSSQVSSKYYSGDIEGAKKSSRLAQIWIIVSVVIGVLAATLYVPLMML